MYEYSTVYISRGDAVVSFVDPCTNTYDPTTTVFVTRDREIWPV